MPIGLLVALFIDQLNANKLVVVIAHRNHDAVRVVANVSAVTFSTAGSEVMRYVLALCVGMELNTITAHIP